jgi:hypothetical protein
MQDTPSEPNEPTDELQESPMTQHAMSLMDVLQPPGNHWLKALSRRGSDLPPGVYIVRFGAADDDVTDDGPEENGDSAGGAAMTSVHGAKRRVAAAMEN